MDKNHNIFQTTPFNLTMIETRRLKNVVIFIQTVLSFVLSRKIKIYIDSPFHVFRAFFLNLRY